MKECNNHIAKDGTEEGIRQQASQVRPAIDELASESGTCHLNIETQHILVSCICPAQKPVVSAQGLLVHFSILRSRTCSYAG